MEAKLTGKTRYRIGFMKKMVLQVEITDRIVDPQDFPHSGPEYNYWRDATIEDVQHLTTTST